MDGSDKRKRLFKLFIQKMDANFNVRKSDERTEEDIRSDPSGSLVNRLRADILVEVHNSEAKSGLRKCRDGKLTKSQLF